MAKNILSDERELLGKVPGQALFYGDPFYSRLEEQNRVVFFFPSM